jgi:hypothetical protein
MTWLYFRTRTVRMKTKEKQKWDMRFSWLRHLSVKTKKTAMNYAVIIFRCHMYIRLSTCFSQTQGLSSVTWLGKYTDTLGQWQVMFLCREYSKPNDCIRKQRERVPRSSSIWNSNSGNWRSTRSSAVFPLLFCCGGLSLCRKSQYTSSLA